MAALCIAGFLKGLRAVVGELDVNSTSPHHTTPTVKLVTTGAYALSRNPAYIVIQLIPMAFAVATNSVWPLTFAIPVIVCYFSYVIRKEEELLAMQFPEECGRSTAHLCGGGYKWKWKCAALRNRVQSSHL